MKSKYNLVRIHIAREVQKEFNHHSSYVDIPVLGKGEPLAAILTSGRFTVEVVKREV